MSEQSYSPLSLVLPIASLHNDFTECAAFVARLRKHHTPPSKECQSASAFLATHVMLFQSLIVSLEGCAHDTIKLRQRLGQLENPDALEKVVLQGTDFSRLMGLSWQATQSHASRTSKTLRDLLRQLKEAEVRCEESLLQEVQSRGFYTRAIQRFGVSQILADATVSVAGVLLFFSGNKHTATCQNATRAFCWFALSNIAFNLCTNALSTKEERAADAISYLQELLSNFRRLERIVTEHARWWDEMSMIPAQSLLSTTENSKSTWDLVVYHYKCYHTEVQELIRSLEICGLKRQKHALESSTASSGSTKLDYSTSGSSYSSFYAEDYYTN